MKKMKKFKKIISLLVAMLLLITPIDTIVFAADGETTVIVDNVYGSPEGTVDVNVTIENNPGILGAILSFSYDEGLTLVNAVAGDALSSLVMSKPGIYTSPCQFAWDGESINENDIKDGIVVTLTFEISKDAVPGTNLNVGVSYTKGDIIDANLKPVTLKTVSGKVAVIDYTPGDLNGDKRINALDIVLLRRYITGGYGITINEYAADVNDDGKINTTDIVYVRRYIAGGYGIRLKPSHGLHEHNLYEYKYTAATCEKDGNISYWYCDICDNYFADADGIQFIDIEDTVIKSNGHNYIDYEAVPATPTTEGYTAGVWCDICETWLHGHEVIPPLKPNESNVSYRHYVQRENSSGNIEIVYDEYLSTHEIINPNPVTYTEGKGIAELIEGVEIDGEKVSAQGYSFLGWYEKPEINASRVYSISNNTIGDKVLYGVWSKNVYTITYLPDSPSSTLPKVEDGSYTIDKETSLKEPPKWPNLVWVGWSDDDGKIIKSIPKGTTGDITLTANWMSRRSQTVPNTKYSTSKPAITIDKENEIYAFTYEIGDIQNVPIQQVEEGVDGKGFNLVKGQTHEINETFIQKISTGEATSVADTIANATTKSDSWTLSEDWNKSTSFSEEHSNEVTQEQSQKAAMSLSQTGKYTISAGVGGTKEHIDETGTATKTTKKHELGVNYEVGTNLNIGVKADLKAGVTKGTPFKNASVGADASVSQKLGLDYKYTTETEKSTHETHTDKSSAYWNLNKGFEESQTLSQSKEFSQSLSQSIKETYNYGETLDFGGSSSNTVSSSNTSSESREYASSVTYSTEEGKEITVSETLTADAETGFYRKVLAANFKVFAVVIYDMKSNTFSTMTYSLKINNSEHLFTDYSTISSFNDYENGVLPFEVPAFVSDYVYGLVGASEGLRFDDETGIIEGYGFKDPATGICYKEYDEITDTYSNPCDTDVIIPRYVVITVGGSQKKIVPVTGISATAFSGTNITSVYLSDKITVIPDKAFENCTELKYVRGGTISTIGNEAFKNCTSLFEVELPEGVVSLGNDAYKGVKALFVNVSKSSVLDAALKSGVEKLSLNLEKLNDSIDGYKIITPENIKYFYLSGGGKTFNNISIESKADTVIVNNIIINNNVDVPLKLSAQNIELGFTTINSNSLIMKLDADNTIITLNGNNYLTTSNDKVALTKNVRFIEKEGSSASGKLRVNGNIFVYGSVIGTQRVIFDSDEHTFVYLTQEEYDKMLNSHLIIFEALGGAVDIATKEFVFGDTYGELPTPTRLGYDFVGWSDKNGNIVSTDTPINETEDIVLYAEWVIKSYSINWDAETNYSVTVNRVNSPYIDAPTGEISQYDTVYYGDELSITYTPNTGYSIKSHGETKITVTKDVTSQDIYANAEALNITYKIIYKSSNGTSLGSTTATYKYGGTYTITPPAKSGYNTPENLIVKWDSVNAKTITFTYTPTYVKTSQHVASGTWWNYDGVAGITYSTSIEYRNRTATTVEVRVLWQNTIKAGYRYGYTQSFNASIGGVSTGDYCIAESSLWNSIQSSAKSSLVTTRWITIPVNTTNKKTITINGYYWDALRTEYWAGSSFTIPAY